MPYIQFLERNKAISAFHIIIITAVVVLKAVTLVGIFISLYTKVWQLFIYLYYLKDIIYSAICFRKKKWLLPGTFTFSGLEECHLK